MTFIQGHGFVDYGTKISKRWIELDEGTAEEEKPTVDETINCSEIAKDIWSRIRGDE